jgi:hypothetical protein
MYIRSANPLICSKIAKYAIGKVLQKHEISQNILQDIGGGPR